MTNVNSGPVDDVYLTWLYNHFAAAANRNPERSFWGLAKKLYTTPFLWFIHNDDNRFEDGKMLRYRFLDETGYSLDDPYRLFLDRDCSVLEMLIALAERAGFESSGSTIEWFWRFMHNLELDRYCDLLWEISIEEEVEEAIHRVIQRTYSPDGTGGLFPLRRADHDQRRVELLYQMSAYLIEGAYLNIPVRP